MQKKNDGMSKIAAAIICVLFLGIVAFASEGPGGFQPGTYQGTPAQAELEQEKTIARKHLEVAKNAMTEIEAEQVSLPADMSQKWQIKEVGISGNKLFSTAELTENMPLIYNSSNLPLMKAPADKLYDFRKLRDVINNPGQAQEISARTIKGFTEYLVSEYTDKNYAGIYVYVPSEPADGVLLINIIEAPVSNVGVKYYDVSGQLKEKGYLREWAIKSWSPVEPNTVANQKKLDHFVNLLNLNPDRYVSAIISRGGEPNTLDLQYDVIEANPWHWFAQIDNSGTDATEWAPRVGVVNTDLIGFDDIFTVVYQTRPDSTFEDNYSVYGSYDFPIWGPRLRLNLYGGYGHFETTPAGSNIDFIGQGYFYGGQLRYNLFQTADKWFVDLIGGFSQEISKNSPQIPPFTSPLENQVRMDLVDYGFDIHRRTDMKETALVFERVQNVGGSSQEDFENSRLGGAAKYFAFDTLALSHKQYLDPNKVQNLIGTFRGIYPEDRLEPAKMTLFGGMYTVRGYAEDEIVADGGILASLQYEFDIVAYSEAKKGQALNESKPWLRRFAPLAFVDYGWAKIKDAVPGEDASETLLSVGPGLTADIGDHFTGVVYWGIALRDTQDTDAGDSKVNVGLLARW